MTSSKHRMSLAFSPSRHPQAPHARFSVEEFHQLCEAVPERRLELIDGEVLEVIAKGTRHSVVVNRLARLIHTLLTSRAEVALELRVESPLDLGPTSEPEPDLALVRLRGNDYLLTHPTAADTQLVIEVADSSLRFDLEGKASLYREAGIENYWVVDVLTPCLILVAEGTAADGPLPAATAVSFLSALKEEVEAAVTALPPAQQEFRGRP